MKNNGIWKMIIGEEIGRLVIYEAKTKKDLENMLMKIKVPETVKVEFIYVENGKS